MSLSDYAQRVVKVMQIAVNEEMIRKAKLGYNAVVADKNGKAKTVSARYLVGKMRQQGLLDVTLD